MQAALPPVGHGPSVWSPHVTTGGPLHLRSSITLRLLPCTKPCCHADLQAVRLEELRCEYSANRGACFRWRPPFGGQVTLILCFDCRYDFIDYPHDQSKRGADPNDQRLVRRPRDLHGLAEIKQWNRSRTGNCGQSRPVTARAALAIAGLSGLPIHELPALIAFQQQYQLTALPAEGRRRRGTPLWHFPV